MSEYAFPDVMVCMNPTICILNTVVVPLAYFMLGLLICMGNSLTIVAVLTSKKLRIASNQHIVSLAVSDLLLGFSAFSAGTLGIRSVLQNKALVTDLCLYDNILWLTASTASNISLALIAIDRYIYILYPLKYQIWVTDKRTAITVLINWLLSLTLGLSSLFFKTKVKLGECITIYLTKNGYHIAVNTIPYLLVHVFVCAVYTRIMTVSFKHQNRIHASTNGSHGSLWRLRLKNLKLILIICGLYLCSWLPFHIFAMINWTTGVLQNALHFLSVLGLLNSLGNVAIYPWMNSDFRRAYASILCYCKRR